MAFHEVRFPTKIAFGSMGGPERRTDIVTLASGFEERNAVWSASRRSYDVSYGVKSLNDLHEVIAFWEARLGRLHGFRFKDKLDFKSCAPTATVTATDQSIGTGDGATAAFQLTKTYSSGGYSFTRDVKKPVGGTVLVAVAGVAKAETTHYTVDTATGLITFTGGNVPSGGQAITAGYEFDVPVRFDVDKLDISLKAFTAGELPSIPIVEIRL